jgi:uncharacterized protein YbcI
VSSRHGRAAASGGDWTMGGRSPRSRRKDGSPVGTPEPESAAELAGRISDEIAAIHEESYGEAIESIQTYIQEDFVLCILDVSLLPHERTLLGHERGEDSIRAVRREFQQAIAPTFAAAVEHMTGRRVIGFLSETHIDPSFNVEFFRLAPHH